MLDGFNLCLAESTGWRINHAETKQFLVCEDKTVSNFKLKFSKHLDSNFVRIDGE